MSGNAALCAILLALGVSCSSQSPVLSDQRKDLIAHLRNLGHEDIKVRKSSARQLGLMGGRGFQAAPRLWQMMSDEEEYWGPRIAAAAAFFKITDDAATVLPILTDWTQSYEKTLAETAGSLSGSTIFETPVFTSKQCDTLEARWEAVALLESIAKDPSRSPDTRATADHVIRTVDR